MQSIAGANSAALLASLTGFELFPTNIHITCRRRRHVPGHRKVESGMLAGPCAKAFQQLPLAALVLAMSSQLGPGHRQRVPLAWPGLPNCCLGIVKLGKVSHGTSGAGNKLSDLS